MAGTGRVTSEAQRPARALDGELLGRLDRRRPGLFVGSLASGALALVFLYCWGYQIANGIGVTGINRPVFWGFYIINFVFWIGISHAGTLISAILRVTKAEWRRPVTRSAEAITLFALAIGGLFPLIHLGRVAIFYYMIPYPNSRMLWPNFRSPLVWDIAAITTYIIGSALYLFLPLIPDAAVMRDRAAAGLKKRFYAVLALGWRGTSQQWHSLEWGIRILAVAIIPVYTRYAGVRGLASPVGTRRRIAPDRGPQSARRRGIHDRCRRGRSLQSTACTRNGVRGSGGSLRLQFPHDAKQDI